MSSTISLEGLLTPGGDEDRAIAHIKVNYRDNVYDWQIYIPAGVDLGTYIEESKARIEADIDAKEAQWEALDPKTREIPDIFGTGTTTVPINKEEIVRPSVPDYYALRRGEYPALREQMDAIWKGNSSSEYKNVFEKIDHVKQKYPKELMSLEQKKLEKCAKVKAKARLTILSVFPEWRQANMTARAVELLSANDLESQEWNGLKIVWGWIKSVRVHSDNMEASIMACQTEEEMSAVDIDVGWPQW